MIDNGLLENHLNDFRDGITSKKNIKTPVEINKISESPDVTPKEIIKIKRLFEIGNSIIVIFAYLIRCTIFGFALNSLFSYSWGILPIFAVGFLVNYIFTFISTLFKK